MKKLICGLAICVFMVVSSINVFAGSFVQDAFGIKYDVGGVPQYDAIEFTEGYNPYIIFNSGNNTSLYFDLTGDNLTNYDGDYVMDVYVNGALVDRYAHRFIELKSHSLTFAPNSNIEFRISALNDYWEEYVRRVYIFNAQFY